MKILSAIFLIAFVSCGSSLLAQNSLSFNESNLYASNDTYTSDASINYINNTTSVIKKKSVNDSSEESKSIDADRINSELVLEVDLQKYLNARPMTFSLDDQQNSLLIHPNTEAIYNNVELLDLSSNKTILSFKLNHVNDALNLEDIPAGQYYLILTNDDGNVYSEKLVVL